MNRPGGNKDMTNNTFKLNNFTNYFPIVANKITENRCFFVQFSKVYLCSICIGLDIILSRDSNKQIKNGIKMESSYKKNVYEIEARMMMGYNGITHSEYFIIIFVSFKITI